jgi:RNA polymerase sigma-70 factor (ECF subfamily)
VTHAEFIRLYDTHVRLVRSILFRMGGAAQLDDLTQDVFLRAWRGRGAFRGEASAKTWVCKIARNVAIDALRAQRPSVPELAPAKPLDASERVEAQEALAQLAPDDRLLLLLLVVEECTMSEVGDILGIPEGTVKSRAFALRRRLSEQLERQGAA